jgi:hypothetical protein
MYNQLRTRCESSDHHGAFDNASGLGNKTVSTFPGGKSIASSCGHSLAALPGRFQAKKPAHSPSRDARHTILFGANRRLAYRMFMRMHGERIDAISQPYNVKKSRKQLKKTIAMQRAASTKSAAVGLDSILIVESGDAIQAAARSRGAWLAVRRMHSSNRPILMKKT